MGDQADRLDETDSRLYHDLANGSKTAAHSAHFGSTVSSPAISSRNGTPSRQGDTPFSTPVRSAAQDRLPGTPINGSDGRSAGQKQGQTSSPDTSADATNAERGDTAPDGKDDADAFKMKLVDDFDTEERMEMVETRASLGGGDVMTFKTTGLHQTAGRDRCIFTLISVPGPARCNARVLEREFEDQKVNVIEPDLPTKRSYGQGTQENAAVYMSIHVLRSCIFSLESNQERDIIELDRFFDALTEHRRSKKNILTSVYIAVQNERIAIYSSRGKKRASKRTDSGPRKRTKNSRSSDDERASDSDSDTASAAPATAADQSFGSLVTLSLSTTRKEQKQKEITFTPLLLYRSNSLYLMSHTFAMRAWDAVRFIVPGLYSEVMTGGSDPRFPLRNRCGILNDVFMTMEHFANENADHPFYRKTLVTTFDLINRPALMAFANKSQVVVPPAKLSKLRFMYSRILDT